MGIIISSLYMLFTFFNLYRVQNAFEAHLEKEGIAYTRYMVNPTILNNFLWHGVAETKEGYVEGYYSILDKIEPFRDTRFYPKNWQLIADCDDKEDIEILKWFSEDYYIVEERKTGTTFNDLRFGAFWLSLDDEPSFIFHFIIENCRARSNQEPPENTGEFFRRFKERIEGY